MKRQSNDDKITARYGVRPKKVYETKRWGLSIKTTERLEKKYGEGLNFGDV